jgi:hypothetical protein
MKEQQREYFRMGFDAILEATQIPKNDERSVIETFRDEVYSGGSLERQFAASVYETDLALKRVVGQSSEVLTYLAALDRKVGLLGQLILSQGVQRAQKDPITIDLSATGIGFDSSVAYEFGALFRLQIIVMPYYSLFEVLARIVHCKEGEEADYRIGAEFEHISEGDRELLIQHVLDRQTHQLRRRAQPFNQEHG